MRFSQHSRLRLLDLITDQSSLVLAFLPEVLDYLFFGKKLLDINLLLATIKTRCGSQVR